MDYLAFEACYDKYASLLYGRILANNKEPEAAQLILQSAFVEYYAHYADDEYKNCSCFISLVRITERFLRS